MGDSWEDWDDEAVAVPGAAAAVPDAAKFADEDETEEEPKWQKNLPKPQAPKKVESRYDESRGAQAVDEGPLDDPVAEKLRQQKLVEDADYEATMELFGSTRELEGFVPKTGKEFEEFGELVAVKYLMPLSKGAHSAHYKAAVKAMLKVALRPMSAGDAKDIETAVAGLRSDKLKEEKAASAGGKKATKKGMLNVGRGGGSAGLDDYKFDDALDDDYDFM